MRADRGVARPQRVGAADPLPARATLYPYPTAALARKDDRTASPWWQSLDSEWDFRLVAKPEDVHAVAQAQGIELPAGLEILGHKGLPMRDLAEWILADGLPVRMQTQLHKFIWEPQTRGV